MKLLRASLLLACLLLAGLAHARDLREQHAKPPPPKGWRRFTATPSSQRRGLRGSAAAATNSPSPTKLHTKTDYSGVFMPSTALDWYVVEGNDCTATCSSHRVAALNGGYSYHAICAIGVENDDGDLSYFFGE